MLLLVLFSLLAAVNCCVCGSVIAEEMSNLKGEKKQLEEENMSFMQKTLDLEEVTNRMTLFSDTGNSTLTLL